MQDEYNDITQQYESYYYYDARSIDDLYLTVSIDGVTYSGFWRDLQYSGGPSLQTAYFTLEGQSLNSPWSAGNTYNTVLTIQLEGDNDAHASAPINVSIIESPIDSFAINNIEVIEPKLKFL